MALKYDSVDWHAGETLSEGVASENPGVHIAFFLGWAAERHLISDLFKEVAAPFLEQFIARQLTPLTFLEHAADGVLDDTFLNAEGNAFAKDYYETNQYLGDYVSLFGEESSSVYQVVPSWENYQKMADHLDYALQSWRQGQEKKPQSLWSRFSRKFRDLWK